MSKGSRCTLGKKEARKRLHCLNENNEVKGYESTASHKLPHCWPHVRSAYIKDQKSSGADIA